MGEEWAVTLIVITATLGTMTFIQSLPGARTGSKTLLSNPIPEI